MRATLQNTREIIKGIKEKYPSSSFNTLDINYRIGIIRKHITENQKMFVENVIDLYKEFIIITDAQSAAAYSEIIVNEAEKREEQEMLSSDGHISQAVIEERKYDSVMMSVLNSIKDNKNHAEIQQVLSDSQGVFGALTTSTSSKVKKDQVKKRPSKKKRNTKK